MSKRKVWVVTGSRADYGLLRWLMEDVQRSPLLDLQVIATGAHLSREFGLTFRNIEEDGFHIDRKVEMLLGSDSPAAIAAAMGVGLIGCGAALRELSPDVLV